MAKIQAVWAIDIGQAALKALKLVPADEAGKVVAEAFDYVEYPKILSQPDADPEELVREAMTTFLERNDLKGSKVAIGVSGQAGLVKFIKLPPVEKKRIPDIVKFEARQQIPFALEEVIWDYQQIGGDDKDAGDDDGGFTMAEVGLFAMKRDQINRAIMPFRNAGIEVDIVQMGPIALYNFASFDLAPGATADGEAKPADGDAVAGDEEKPRPKPKGKAEDKGSVVLLDIGADNTDLIITDGTRIWQRNVPIGGNHFTRALTKELKLTFAKAEHLKRNATKAPDPRAVFTAMRGIFNDFSSEVNRSIGFYASVNRQSKITKVVGLGNGFKLPGLQKFLQQNLSYDIEKLESFQRLTGEEVTAAPQFQENLMSFAVAYGLAVQGLGVGGLRTNLLPPEIEQVRMIRRKKPWALAASAFLLLGFSALFLGDWGAWAKVTSPAFESAVASAKTVASTGSDAKAKYKAAQDAFAAELERGKALVAGSDDTTNWPEFLKTVSQTLPDPAKEYGLDPNNPENVPLLGKLRVHIDAILPVWRQDLAAGWYNDLLDYTKQSMPGIDQKTAPSGEGWVVQVIGHHYNPPRVANTELSEREKKIALGPWGYLQQAVLPRFWAPRLRIYGITHPALKVMEIDKTWTTEKGATGPSMPALERLARAEAPVEAAGGEGGAGGGKMGMGMQMPSGPGGMGGPGMGGGGGMPGMGTMGDQRKMGMAGMGMAGMMPGGMGGMGPMGGDAAKKIKPSYLTRTDFKIEFVWKPQPADKLPKTAEEWATKVAEIQKEMEDANKDVKGALLALDETKIAEASQKVQAKAISDQDAINQRATGAATGTGTGTPPAGMPTTPKGATPPAATKGAAPPATGGTPKK